MIRLALLRHGRTEWNETGKIQGRTDTCLSVSGRKTVASWRLPREFADDAVVSSPLRRATETAMLLTDLEPQIVPELIETDWGDWEGRTLESLRREFGETMKRNEERGLDFLPPDGESPRQVGERVMNWLDALHDTHFDMARYVGVTHKGVIRALYARASGWDMVSKPDVKLDWESLHVFYTTRPGLILTRDINVSLKPD